MDDAKIYSQAIDLFVRLMESSASENDMRVILAAMQKLLDWRLEQSQS